MTGPKLFLKLRKYGKNRSELQNFCSKNIKEILRYLPDQILKSDGDLNRLFPGLSDPTNLSHKIKVVDIVLEVLRKEPTSLSHCGNIISRVCLELSRMPFDAVVRWCNDSVESIIKDTDVNMIWRDIIPECLNVKSSTETVNCNSSIITADEFRKQTVQKLLECQWKENQLVQLTAMFTDLQLPRQEHRKFVIKICTFIRDMSPESLPPLVHQLLKLCKVNNVEVVLAHLSNYFNLRLYSKLAAESQDSESTTMDVDDIEQFSVTELHICLSTCIYHMTDAAEPEAIRKQLKAWPRSQLTREPFILSVALAMVDKGMEFKAVCLDVVRLAIEQTVLDEIRRKESAWIRRVLPSDLDLDEMMRELATGGGNHRSSTWMGLINLSIALLSGTRGPVSRLCVVHGATTLARLAKAHPCTAPQILSSLADRLAADSSHLPYIECLRLLCKMAPLSVEPCSELRSILESYRPAPGADGVFAAVHPLINFSERLRDTLVMSCRKGLYSRDSAHRCLAASGILTVLKHLRISSATLTSTQEGDDYSSQCSQSYISLLTVDVHSGQVGVSVSSRVSKETICHEMVSILRRCLGQDADVKRLLYSRWYSSVKDKPSLHNTLLEILYEHLVQYLPEDGEGDMTLLIDKCVQVTPTTAVLSEPIGYLLYLIAQLLQTTSHDDVDIILASQRQEENLPRMKLKKIMTELSNCNLLEQIDMENLSTSDATVESKANCIKVQQLLQVYEALFAHNVMQWNASRGHADVVYRIYKQHTQLFDNTKSPTKLSKKTSKLNDSLSSVKSRKSQASTKSQKDSNDKEKLKKTPKTAKDKAVAFKPLPCLWDLKICYRVLELLYSSEVNWSSAEERSALRGRGVVHCWVASEVVAALQRTHDPAHALAHAPRIAALLFKNCLCQFQDIYDFGDETALNCLEMFDVCLSMLSSAKYNLDADVYLAKITGANTTPVANKSTILKRVRNVLFTVEHSLSQTESAVDRRLVRAAVNVVVTVLKIPSDFHLDLSKEISKIENHVRETKQECVGLLGQLLATVAAESCETTLLDDLLKRLADVLATDSEEPNNESQSTQDPVQFPWVQAGMGAAVRAAVRAHVLARLACAKHTLERARDLAATVTPNRSATEKELKEARKSCVLQLCQVARAARSLCALDGGGRGGVGGPMVLPSRLLLLAAKLLRSLNAAEAQDAGVENLLKLMGNTFTSVLRLLLERYENERMSRLVREAENFRSCVLQLDTKDRLGYQKYVSESIVVGIGTQAGSADTDADAADETRDTEDENMDVDSDADTTILERDDED